MWTCDIAVSDMSVRKTVSSPRVSEVGIVIRSMWYRTKITTPDEMPQWTSVI